MKQNLWLRQLLALVRKEFQQIVRDPSSYLVAGVLPFVFLLLFGYGITLDAGILRLAVLNESGGRHSLDLAADFAHSPWFSTRGVNGMDEAAPAKVPARPEWVKKDKKTPLTLEKDGQPINLAPGNTWVELMPKGTGSYKLS